MTEDKVKLFHPRLFKLLKDWNLVLPLEVNSLTVSTLIEESDNCCTEFRINGGAIYNTVRGSMYGKKLSFFEVIKLMLDGTSYFHKKILMDETRSNPTCIIYPKKEREFVLI